MEEQPPPQESVADSAAAVAEISARGWRKTFRAFGYRDYRLLWTGSFISSCGTWMQEVAQNWLILTVTGSVWWLGVDAFLGEVPFLMFSLIGGVVADRFDRRKILLGSQIVQLTNAFLLAGLVFLHAVHIWEILLLSFLTGLAQSFGGPAYQALVPTLVPREDVPNAVSLQSTQFNLARVVGPVLAGLAYTAFGPTACFTLNGLSFFVVIGALLVIPSRFVRRTDHPPVLESLIEGLRFVQRNRAMNAFVALACAGSLLAFPLVTFIPVFAKTIFLIGPGGYSRMLAVFGVGGVLGAVTIASFGNFRRKGVTAIAAQMTFAALMIAFATSRTLSLSYVLLFFCGGALVAVFSIFLSVVQLLVTDQMRGRVMSVYMLAFRGAMPLGNLIAASAAARFSVTAVLVANGILLLIFAAFMFSIRVRELAAI